ncbi:MAG: hypothetical protein U0641_05820 [Anaerolineae bacterium]
MAYQQGIEAHLSGYPVFNNPYPKGSQEFVSWRTGWYSNEAWKQPFDYRAITNLERKADRERMKTLYPTLFAFVNNALDELVERETDGLLRALPTLTPVRARQLVAARLWNGAANEWSWLMENLNRQTDYDFNQILCRIEEQSHSVISEFLALSGSGSAAFFEDAYKLRTLHILLPKPIYEEE